MVVINLALGCLPDVLHHENDKENYATTPKDLFEKKIMVDTDLLKSFYYCSKCMKRCKTSNL
jgi:hypothetical protein